MLQCFNPFRQPTAEQIAKEQRDNATRQLLLAQAALEHAQAAIAMHQATLKRLGAWQVGSVK